jgi:DNA-binding transcriptional regulator PaaX
MPKKVDKWETDKGLLFDTEEEALEEERKDKIWKRYQELAKDKIGSPNVIATSFDVLWNNQEELATLLMGK